MRLLNQLRDWLAWKGLTIKELLIMGGALGFLIFVAGLMTYGMILSLL